MDWIDGPFRERPIGVCWSWDRSYAKAHHGVGHGQPGRVKVLVKGRCLPEDVDWFRTAVLNASAHYTVGEEKEIRLLPGRMVEIESIFQSRGKTQACPARELHRPGRLLSADEPCPSPAP